MGYPNFPCNALLDVDLVDPNVNAEGQMDMRCKLVEDHQGLHAASYLTGSLRDLTITWTNIPDGGA